MRVFKVVSKRRFSLLLLLFVLMILCAVLTVLIQPFLVHRLLSKIYTNYEIYLLKYPNSYLVESKIRPTSKVTMATDYTYCTSDDIDTVREYFEKQIPGFVHLQGPRVVNEPTYSNRTCADEMVFKYFFQAFGLGGPCIEIKIYPSDVDETLITITEHWSSMGFPGWVRGL